MMLYVIIMIVIALGVLRFLLRKRRAARKIRRETRRQARVHRGMNRRIMTRGIALGQQRNCGDCGEHEGKCKHLTKRAEHAEGMLGKLKD